MLLLCPGDSHTVIVSLQCPLISINLNSIPWEDNSEIRVSGPGCLGCVSAVNLIVEKASAKFWSLCRKVLSPPPTVVYIFKSRDIIAR